MTFGKPVYSANWINNKLAYWIKGKRVSRADGYKWIVAQGYNLPQQFHDWHKENQYT